jgi:hypothetical protein
MRRNSRPRCVQTSYTDQRTMGALPKQDAPQVAGTGGAWHAEIPSTAMYFNLPEEEVSTLEAELQRWLTWANGGAGSEQSTAPDMTAVASSSQPLSTSPAAEALTNASFVWKPSRHPNADRNRKRVRIGFVVFALAIIIAAASSEWENGAGSVLFSMTVPIVIVLIAFGVDKLYDAGRRFEISVLTAPTSRSTSSIEL